MAEHDHAGHDHDHDHAHPHDHDHDHGHDHDHAHDHEGEETAKGEQKVSIEDIGPARKRLTIEIPAERISKKIESGFAKLKTDAAVPGFRRGRVPMRLLQRRFGESIRDDIRGQLLSECYTQAVEDEKLDVIGEPDIKDYNDIKMPESGPMVFKVEVEVTPSVELPSLEGIAVKKPTAGITDADVDKEINGLRDRLGKLGPVEGGELKARDLVYGNVRVLEGENAAEGAAELANHPNTYIIVPGEDQEFRGPVLGMMIDDLGKRLVGKKAGDDIDISTKAPSVYEDEKIRDKAITLKIHVDKIERLEPASMESLLQQSGVATADALKQNLRGRLDERRERETQSVIHEQICNFLLEKVNLTLPEGLTGRQTARVLRRQAMEMAYRGMTERDIEQHLAELRTKSEEDARRQLKLFFILDKAANDLNVDVSENEVNGRIAMLAHQQGRRPEKLRQELARNGSIEQIYLQIREQKTLDKIMEKAQVTDVAKAPADVLKA